MDEVSGLANNDPQVITLERALKILTSGVISVEHGLLPWGSNYVYLISVTEAEPFESDAPPQNTDANGKTKDAVSLLAVYKPQRGERPLWDFPSGTLCLREVATFLVSEQLGWQLVPPTVLRGGPFGLGSVQFFIDHDPEVNYFTPFPDSCDDQLKQFAVFDAIVNNVDRKGGHCLLDGQGHLWGIDHGLTFHPTHKLRTVIWDYEGQPISQPLLDDLQTLGDTMSDPDNPFNQALRKLLSRREFEAFRARVERVRNAGRFPRQGSGASYPWPPV